MAHDPFRRRCVNCHGGFQAGAGWMGIKRGSRFHPQELEPGDRGQICGCFVRSIRGPSYFLLLMSAIVLPQTNPSWGEG